MFPSLSWLLLLHLFASKCFCSSPFTFEVYFVVAVFFKKFFKIIFAIHFDPRTYDLMKLQNEMI